MKYSPLIYAHALKTVLDETPAGKMDSVLKNFMAVLLKNGDRAQGNKIVELLEDLLTKEAGGKVVSFETARALPNKEFLLLKERFNSNDSFRQKIIPSLVAGVRVVVNGNQELDHSLVRRLNKIFTK